MAWDEINRYVGFAAGNIEAHHTDWDAIAVTYEQ
jgi:hypothetical protein